MFHGWDNFYLMMGSAGGGLIGLLFVVVTLTSGFDRDQALRGARLYMTPTAVHFAVVLSVSAAVLAPGLSPAVEGVLIGLLALGGLALAIRAFVGIRNPREGSEPPHWSDAWMYGGAPAAVYGLILAAAFCLGESAAWAPYAVAVLLLTLLLVGLRNAWDLVTWIAPARNATVAKAEAPPAPPQDTDSAL